MQLIHITDTANDLETMNSVSLVPKQEYCFSLRINILAY